MLSIPVPMKKIRLIMMDSEAQQAAITLARLHVMHPLEEHDLDQPLKDYPAKPFHGAYNSLQSRFAKISSYLEQPLSLTSDSPDIVSLNDLQHSDNLLQGIWSEISKLEEQLRSHQEKMNNQRQLAASIEKFSALDLDLSRLHRQSRFLKVLAGTVPTQNLKQLEQALSLASFVLTPFYSASGSEYVVIVGSTLQQEDVQELLRSADFREVNIPDEFAGSPAEMQHETERKLEDLRNAINEIGTEISNLVAHNLELIQNAYDLLYKAKPYASLDMVLKGKGGLVSLQGWVPAHEKENIVKELHKDLDIPFHVEFFEPETDEYGSVPTLLKHNWLFKPFQALVSSFGIPSYTEIDPTRLFTLSYILMFGMMFGDIGHGLVISVVGLFAWKKYPSVTIVTVMAGLSSAFFGLVYGSLFGYEHIINPLWMSPMHDPQKVLLIAVVWGAGFILIANALGIRNALAVGRMQQALLSGKGLAGLLFYLALIYMSYRAYQSANVGWIEALLLMMPMAVILFYLWTHSSGALGERILVVSIEGLEHVIGTLSNTLSFLRVAAFSLNHIALAAAVFSIAGMLDVTGHWITVVLGNIFIIVLEGAIVAIQCLRLEYYEGFSRFFEGKGKAFEPLKH